MDVYILLPDAIDNLSVLVRRLRQLCNVSVLLQAKLIRISGPLDRVFRAQVSPFEPIKLILELCTSIH